MAGFSVTGQMKVKTLQSSFLREFSLFLRIYDGRSQTDSSKSLSEVRKKKGSGKGLAVAKNMKVGNLESKFEEEFGLKVQVAGSDDSYLCDDSLTLKAAQEKDQRRLDRQVKKQESNKHVKGNIEKNNYDSVSQSFNGDSDKDVKDNDKPKVSVGSPKPLEEVEDKSLPSDSVKEVNPSEFFMKDISLEEAVENIEFSMVSEISDSVDGTSYDLLTGDRINDADEQKAVQRNTKGVRSEEGFMREVLLSDLELEPTNTNTMDFVDNCAFEEFNLKD